MYQSLKYPRVSIYQPQKSQNSYSLQNKQNTEDILMYSIVAVGKNEQMVVKTLVDWTTHVTTGSPTV